MFGDDERSVLPFQLVLIVAKIFAKEIKRDYSARTERNKAFAKTG